MRVMLKNVVALLEKHAEKEWEELKAQERTNPENRTAYESERVVAQRARWAAWDEALLIAKGERSV